MAGDESARQDHRAVRHDVRVAEVHIAPDDRMPVVGAAVAARSEAPSSASHALPRRLLTNTSGGCPGLQAGEESGTPRSGASRTGSPYGAPPMFLHVSSSSCEDADGVPVPG